MTDTVRLVIETVVSGFIIWALVVGPLRTAQRGVAAARARAAARCERARQLSRALRQRVKLSLALRREERVTNATLEQADRDHARLAEEAAVLAAADRKIFVLDDQPVRGLRWIATVMLPDALEDADLWPRPTRFRIVGRDRMDAERRLLQRLSVSGVVILTMVPEPLA